MWRLFVHRILAAIPTLIGVSILSFALIRMVPGDPVTMMLGERGGSPEAVAELRAALGLDRPLLEQYGLFISRALKGDLGQSIVARRPVWDEFKDRFPATVELTVVALLFGVIIGLPLGISAAAFRHTWWDRLVTGGVLIAYSLPIFWWGLLLILVFSIALGVTPVAGRIPMVFDVDARTGFMLIDAWWSGGFEVFWQSLRHLALPAIALGTIPLAAIVRMTRATLLEILREDFIRTARAKGAPEWRVVAVHGLANALIPIVTVIGLMGSTLLTGAILTETIFAWPGIGKWLVASVTARDYPVLQGGLLLICIIVMSVNLLVDMLYSWLNPLVRKSS